MEKDTSLQVIYIAGNGHSGSTLLDIILGSNEGCFSAGELTFICRDTIMEEYCSCKSKIPDCLVWSEVIKIWESEREISYEKYKELRFRFERNKTTFRTLYNRFLPSEAFRQYCYATLKLFQAIQKVTGSSVVIDSSKSPQRIAVLSKILDVKVLHICRDFTGVLNSSKGSVKKNMEAGIEADIPAGKTWKVTLDWIGTNIITELFCICTLSQKVMYKEYVKNPAYLQEVHPFFGELDAQKTFSASHMLAGNALRLKKDLKINPEIGFLYKKLDDKNYFLGRLMDKLFFFWN